jgi:hypothetical protein
MKRVRVVPRNTHPPSQVGESFGIEKVLQMLEEGSRGGGK